MGNPNSAKAASGMKVNVVPHGDRAILITRSFAAPRKLVFDAMSKPEMMTHWFHGPPGWTLTTCEVDLRVGGSYRWVWTNHKGQEMGMGGNYLEVVPPERIVSTEKFDQSWYPGEAAVSMVLTEGKGSTLMSMTVTYESTAARDGVLASPMQNGLEFGYDRLEEFLAQKVGAKAKKENALFAGISQPETVDAFMKALKHPLHDVAQQLRSTILGADGSIGEGIFWNAPTFYYTGPMKPFDPKTYKRYIVGFNFFKQDCVRLIFLRGADASDPSGILEGDYADGRRLLLIHSLDELKQKEKELKKVIKQLLASMN